MTTAQLFFFLYFSLQFVRALGHVAYPLPYPLERKAEGWLQLIVLPGVAGVGAVFIRSVLDLLTW